jgi:hypothetical protein
MLNIGYRYKYEAEYFSTSRFLYEFRINTARILISADVGVRPNYILIETNSWLAIHNQILRKSIFHIKMELI